MPDPNKSHRRSWFGLPFKIHHDFPLHQNERLGEKERRRTYLAFMHLALRYKDPCTTYGNNLSGESIIIRTWTNNERKKVS
jgi:hypothetical protein